MEEIVRAFNFVIDQGWVRAFIRTSSPCAFSNLEPRRREGEACGCSAPIFVVALSHPLTLARFFRLSTGPRLSGLRKRSKKPSVRPAALLPDSLRSVRAHHCPLHLLDVASKLGLIGPIAEQCQHQCVLNPPAWLSCCSYVMFFAVCSTASVRRRSMRECASTNPAFLALGSLNFRPCGVSTQPSVQEVFHRNDSILWPRAWSSHWQGAPGSASTHTH